MKTLVIGDPHGKLPKGLTQIIKKNKIELIIVTGEIPCVPMEVFAPRKLKKYGYRYADNNYKQLLDKICLYKIPVIILKGNAYVTSEGSQITRKLFEKYKNLFYKRTGKVKIKDHEFVLFDMIWEVWAYKGFKLGKWPHQFSSRSDYRLKKFGKLLKEAKDPILISHAPPFGILDKVPKKGSVGSKIVLKMIKKYKPKYVFCGHIHEGKGKKKIGKTTVINAGCCGDYFIINLK